MKYTRSIVIDRPIEDVIRLMDNTENMLKWQEGLQRWEHISGEAGHPGAKMKLYYDMGGRKVELLETILLRDFPDSFDATYDTKGVHNIQKNTFEALDATTTKWTSESEFKFSGFMKVMAFFMSGAFPKQTEKFMQNFKNFAESAP